MEQYCYMLEKDTGIITADWMVLLGWVLGSWWIAIRWLYFHKKNLQNMKEADGTNLYIMKCPVLSLDWTEHAFST